MSNAEVGGPRRVLVLPARIDVVDLVIIEEVGPVDGKLVISIELALEGEIGRPGVRGVAAQDEHAVVDGRAVDGTQGIL